MKSLFYVTFLFESVKAIPEFSFVVSFLITFLALRFKRQNWHFFSTLNSTNWLWQPFVTSETTLKPEPNSKMCLH